ncbi:MAG: Cell division coordinator CpoB [Deltaproteobacteria bacterium]|nr:Cell division coordinator CpoB [Deltaproteobacteria bacterium]
MKKIYFVLIVILALALSGCVMVKNEEWAKLQQDIADIKRDSEDVKKEKDALRLQLDSLKSKIQEIEKSTGAQFSTRVVALEKTISDAEKDIRKKQADIVADITAIRSDFQVLTGRFEETRYAIQKGAQEGKSFRDEVEIKLKETAQILEEFQKRLASVEQVTALLRQGKEQGTLKASESTSFEDAYKDAYETFQKGDYKAAREKFQNYLESHPGSKYSDNALYWIGESYYNEKSYEKAIVVYDDVVKKYPDGGKAPAALLKQGMAFSVLGDKKNASVIYKKVIERYPRSEQADVAKKKLKE